MQVFQAIYFFINKTRTRTVSLNKTGNPQPMYTHVQESVSEYTYQKYGVFSISISLYE